MILTLYICGALVAFIWMQYALKDGHYKPDAQDAHIYAYGVPMFSWIAVVLMAIDHYRR